MDIYNELGIKKRINAAACYTALGGSIMPYEVIADELSANDLARLDIAEFRDLDLEVVFVYRDDDYVEPLNEFIATVRRLETERHSKNKKC